MQNKMCSVLSLVALLWAGQTFALGANKTQWYRGNTHSHTILSGHGDTAPEQVAAWYLDHGYNFLVLSEHNKFIDPTKVVLPTPRRADFILVPGVELTGKQSVHTTALNVKKVLPWHFDHPERWRIAAEHVRLINEAGGKAILNHPTWKWTLGLEDLMLVEKLEMFELYNGAPDSHNHGDLTHDGTEKIWDGMLTAGKKVFGVASDDAHQFQSYNPGDSNPGSGWVMVQAKELTADAIVKAMSEGHFYASSGVVLSEIEKKHHQFSVVVDLAETEKMLDKKYVVGHLQGSDSHPHINYPAGWTVEWISAGGKILKSERPTWSAKDLSGTISFSTKEAQTYLRAKFIFVREKKAGQKEAFYAWTQPAFLK